jgi:hypothetical protein
MRITARATHIAGRLQLWLSTRHPLRSEAAAVLIMYGLYELARGLVVSYAREADRHAPARGMIVGPNDNFVAAAVALLPLPHRARFAFEGRARSARRERHRLARRRDDGRVGGG